jgi:N-acetylglucosamine-6-sulfatase
VAAASILLAGCLGDDPANRPENRNEASAPPGSRPNLIVVMTDDQTVQSFNPQVMPFTWRLFHREGTIFDDAVASPPLCCPARAGFITGQYPHNHGVNANVPGYALLRDPGNILPAWLQGAGYRTAMIGKYLNGYELVEGAKPGPGWDEWFAEAGYPAYFNYQLSDNGEPRTYRDAASDYSTRVMTDRALDVIGQEDRPLFMWLALNAPHIAAPAKPPCDGGNYPQPPNPGAFQRFADAPLPHSPSFDERDVSDKPAFIRRKSPIDPAELDVITKRWRCGLSSLPPADDGIRRLVARLRASGQWDRTVLVFVSDNGFFFGEHRIENDKRLPYEPALQVPMAIRVPPALGGRGAPERVSALVTLQDLAPTFLDFAGGRPCVDEGCREIDGRSLRPLLSGEESDWPDDRGVLVELAEGFTYSALRTSGYLYSETTADRDGPLDRTEIELYDLQADPDELHNLWREDRSGVADLQEALAARLDALRDCAGPSCRR